MTDHIAPPLSLYIHMPWCVSKCPYCDFNSHEVKDAIPQQAYIDALIADLDQELPLVWGRQLHSIYIGGGTPSLFHADAIQQLLDAIRARFPFTRYTEVSMESNPASADMSHYAGYSQAGVNRLSIGIQSFNDDALRVLGRAHNAERAHAAITTAKQAGFENINADLMFCLPGQQSLQATQDVQQLLDTDIAHISFYHLTIEEHTAFYHNPPALPDEDSCADIEDSCYALLTDSHQRYEVSAFARPGKQCKHNLNYWRFGDYLGIGAGAHGKLSLPQQKQIIRYSKQRQPKHYMNESGTEKRLANWQALDEKTRRFEFLMNRLRLQESFNTEDFRACTWLPEDMLPTTLQKAVEEGLVTEHQGNFQVSTRGLNFLNVLLSRLME